MARVAIVDDSPDTVEVFQVILRDSHEFVPYVDPQKFLQEFKRDEFALILVDIAMPILDGYEVFRQIREVDKDVPVCAVTATDKPGEKEKALRLGFCDYFAKPILEIERFREMVHSHIGGCANPPHK